MNVAKTHTDTETVAEQNNSEARIATDTEPTISETGEAPLLDDKAKDKGAPQASRGGKESDMTEAQGANTVCDAHKKEKEKTEHV